MKATYIFQELPGEKVKLFSPQRGESRICSKNHFDEMRKDPEISARTQFVEHKPQDVGDNYKTDSGFEFSVFKKEKKQ